MPTAPANQDAPTSPKPSSQDVACVRAGDYRTTAERSFERQAACTRPSHERSNRPNKFNKNKRNKRGPNGRGKPNKRFGAAEAFVADYATMAEEVAYASRIVYPSLKRQAWIRCSQYLIFLRSTSRSRPSCISWLEIWKRMFPRVPTAPSCFSSHQKGERTKAGYTRAGRI